MFNTKNADNVKHNKQFWDFVAKKHKSILNEEGSKLGEIESVLLEYGIRSEDEINQVCSRLSQADKDKLCKHLLHFLSFGLHANERMLIFEVLTLAKYCDVVEILLTEFWRKECEDRWGIGDLLYNTACKQYYEQYVAIAKDSEFGVDRQMVVLIFGKLKLATAKSLLISLLNDPTVYGHALDSLSKICSKNDLPIFLRFTDCECTWIKKIAINFVKKHS